MRTIVQQFAMFPPSKQTLGARLLQGGRDVSRPIAVPTSAAPKAWFGSQFKSHGLISPQGPWTLGQGGMGFGGFGSLNGDMLVQGIEFNHVWSMEDLISSTKRAKDWLSEVSGGPRGAEYPPQDFGFSPVPAALLQVARTSWNTLNEAAAAGNTAAIDAVRDFSSTLSSAAREVDATWDGVRAFIASRPPDVEYRRTTALKTIARTLNAIIDRAKVIQNALDAQRAAGAASNAGAASAGAAAQTAAQAARNAATGTGSKLPPALIFGGVAAVGVVVFLIARRSKA